MHIPKVSIGMPVYNGEKFIREALDSLLAQTFTDFELIISDNASTDGTEAICREYATKDARIRYVRQIENKGAQDNFIFVLDRSCGQYFTWLAYDDFIYPAFLETTIKYIDDHDDVVLCLSDFYNINEEGNIVATISPDVIRDSEEWISARRYFFLYKHGLHIAIYGVFTSHVLKDNICKAKMNGFMGMVNGNEFPLLVLIALQGRIVAIPEILRVHRIHSKSISIAESSSCPYWLYIINMIYIIALRMFPTLIFSNLGLMEKINIIIFALKYYIATLFRSGLRVRFRKLKKIFKPVISSN